MSHRKLRLSLEVVGDESPACGRGEQLFFGLGRFRRASYTESSPAVKMGL